MTRFLIVFFAVLSWIAMPRSAAAALQICACEPEWAALAERLGGERVEVFTATTGRQDAHRIQARPSLIARMARADLVVCTGAELEAGWLPLLLRQSANGKVQPGAPGYFETARFVQMKEVPVVLDRSLGDIHAAGNPHFHTDPRSFLPIGSALADRLGQIDPAGAAAYAGAYRRFATAWSAAIAGWEARAKPLAGVPIVVQHKNWVYLLNWLGLKEVAALEPKPGVPASAAHLAHLIELLRKTPARMAIHAAYENDRPSRWLSEQTGIPGVELPYTVGGTPEATTLEAVFDQTLDRLLAAAQAHP